VRSRLPILCLIGVFLQVSIAAGTGSREVADTAFAEGIAHYEAKEYAQALAAWRGVLREGYVSPELLVNLGDAAYKMGELGWAIYYFEQARRRAPADPDIASNLALARREALGTETSTDRSAALDFVASVQNRWTLAGAVRAAAALVWIAVGAVLLSWLWASPRLASVLRWGALGLVVVAALLVGTKAFQRSLEPEALAIRPVSARSEPSKEATVEFRLPAGSPVGLAREAPGWHEIVVSTSLRGWVEDTELARFAAPGEVPGP
jgi:tetratricopeptide (TPR) repeat protein